MLDGEPLRDFPQHPSLDGKARCSPHLDLSQPPPQQLELQCQQPCPLLLCHRLLPFKCSGSIPQQPPHISPEGLPVGGSMGRSHLETSLMSSVIKVLIRQVGLPHRVPSPGGERAVSFLPITSASARFTFTARDGDRVDVDAFDDACSGSCFLASLPLPFKSALSCPPYSGSSQARPLTYPSLTTVPLL